jgi:mannose-6-phosphate isomerase-like protein (cupin superfamily)
MPCNRHRDSGTREVEFKTGASATNAAIPWHEVTNIGDTPLSFVVVEMKY